MATGRKKLVMCQVCRGLIESSATTCPLCGREAVPKARIAVNVGSGNFISLVLLTINIVLFLLMSVVEVRSGRGGADAFLQIASRGVRADFGGLVPALVRQGQWWRLVTFNFLHIGLMHLLFNSSALYSIGPRVEEIFGSQKFVFAYVGTGIASGVASYLFLPAETAGASGAIFGLIGLLAAYGYRQGGSFGRDLMRQMLIWAGIGIVFGFFIGANNVAHVGGFIAGGALGFVLEPDAPSTTTSASVWNATAIACIGLVAVSFTIAGRAYGTEQERWQQQSVKVNRARAAFQLAEAVEQTKIAINESFDANLKSEPFRPETGREMAAQLKQSITRLEGAPIVDDASTAIRKRLIELFDKRPKALESATNQTQLTAALAADEEAFISAFHDFDEWADNQLEEFQRSDKR